MTEVLFSRLLQARALDELTTDERRELERLAAGDAGRTAALGQWDRVHALFAAERRLRQQVTAPVQPTEEADEGFQRLQRGAARAEQELRAQLLHAPRPGIVPLRRIARPGAWLAAALALFAVGLWWLLGAGRAPALLPDAPQDRRAGGQLQLVLLEPVLTAQARTIRWAAVAGASGYDVVVVDPTGNVVAQRDVSLQKSTAWELTAAQFEALRAHAALALRVSALDGAGIAIGSSGELALTLR